MKDHVQLGEELGLVDFDTGAVVGLFHSHWAIVYSRREHVDGVCVGEGVGAAEPHRLCHQSSGGSVLR